jgi:hypothetical protein
LPPRDEDEGCAAEKVPHATVATAVEEEVEAAGLWSPIWRWSY